MKWIQMGRAKRPPVSAEPSDRLMSYPSHTPATRLGRNPTNHTSVASSVVPVLPASGRPQHFRLGPRAALDHALHDVHEHVRGLGPHDLLGFGDMLLQDPPLAVGDLADRERFRPNAAVGEHAIGRDQLQQVTSETPSASAISRRNSLSMPTWWAILMTGSTPTS